MQQLNRYRFEDIVLQMFSQGLRIFIAMNSLETYIHQFFGVDKEQCKTVAGFFKSETVAKNQFFLKTDKYCDKLSFIDSGLLRIFVELAEKEVTQWIATPGYFITDLSSFLFSSKSRWNIQALTDCELYTIKYRDYIQLNNIIANWNELERLFIGKCFITLENRVFTQISLSSEERYNLLFSQQRELFNLVPLQYLASMLGMTPETFSRIRAKKSS